VSLREQAHADLLSILEDASGFAGAITVKNPAGTVLVMQGLSNDVSSALDPETGQIVSVRRASVALSIARLEAAGMGLPVGIADPKLKPWLVTFAAVGGLPQTFKVTESHPDALGVITCELEAYKS
jgi:hypothetical protein